MTEETKLIYRLIDMAENMRSVAKELEKVNEDRAKDLRGAADFVMRDWVKSLQEEMEKKIKKSDVSC